VSRLTRETPARSEFQDAFDPSVRWLIEQRYGQSESKGPSGGAPGAVAATGGSNTLALLLSHRSVRRYLPTALDPHVLELLVAAAQSAASSSNLQLWSVVSVEDPENRRALSELAGNQAHVRECPLFLVWIADLHRARELARARGIASDGLNYLESFLVAAVDAALAAQNAVVAAESMGLGTVYIGALRNHPERVAQILGLPAQAFALFGLCVGWPDTATATAVKPRLPQAVVLHRDRYGLTESEHELVGHYDAVSRHFYTTQQLSNHEGGWSWHSARRLATAAALNGRHVLREALTRLGFPLE